MPEKTKTLTVDDYIGALPEDRREAVTRLRKTLKKHLPKGFQEGVSSGMICYSVPHSIFPAGYHCDPKSPLPFISVASQKGFIAMYHMGLYADKALLDWFTKNYKSRVATKLDMGKSCVRFKKPADIPFDLISELAEKMTPEKWIGVYSANLKR